jgi:hypothetical protein
VLVVGVLVLGGLVFLGLDAGERCGVEPESAGGLVPGLVEPVVVLPGTGSVVVLFEEETGGNGATVTGTDLVWKLSTAARPAMVVPITNGARLKSWPRR